MDEDHEGEACLFVAQGDAAEALEPVEEAFDLMVLFVEPPVDWDFADTAWVALDLRARAEITGDEGA